MKLLYFAWLRTRTGIGSEELEKPADVATVADLVTWLQRRSPGHEDAFRDLKVVRAAVNQAYVPFEHPVRDEDEVAFFPPVTGG